MISESDPSSSGEARPPWWRHPAIWIIGVVLLLGGAALFYLRMDDAPPSEAGLRIVVPPGRSPSGVDLVQSMIEAERKIDVIPLPSSTGSAGSVTLSTVIWREMDWSDASNWPKKAARSYLAKHAEVWEEIRSAISRPAMEWDFSVKFDTFYSPKGAVLRNVIGLIKVHCLDSLARGDWTEAVDSATLQLKFGNIVAERAPSWLGSNLAAWSWYRGRELCMEAAAHPAIPVDQVVELAKEMHACEPSVDWLCNAFRVESQITKNILSDPHTWAELADSPWRDKSGKPIPLNAKEQLLYNENRTRSIIFQYYRAQIASISGFTPLASRMVPGKEKSSFLWKNDTGRRVLHWFHAETDWGPELLVSYAEFKASILRVALLAYHKQNGGRFPASLTDLTPSILPSLPADPFSGKDFGYRPTAGYIYSVGRDRVDNGGAPNSKSFHENLDSSSNDDLTMRLLPPPKPPARSRRGTGTRGSVPASP